MSYELKQYMKEYDQERIKFVMQVESQYRHGTLSRKEARKQLRERVGSIHPIEIAVAEQELKTYQSEQCQKLDIQSMMDLFEDLMDVSRPKLPADHPLMSYYRENDRIREQFGAIEDLVQYPVIKNQWYEIYDQLKAWITHMIRKQNQLYPVLEKKGFDRPTTTMWVLDDFVKEEIKQAEAMLETNEDSFISMQAMMIADLKDLIQKEESVLYPVALAFVTPEEFQDMKSGDKEIGYAYPELEQQVEQQLGKQGKSNGMDIEISDKQQSGAKAQQSLNVDAAKMVMATEELDVATGKLSLDQINHIFRNMPVDLSYVDENEIVKFYTDTKHRVFPRSKNVIGRDVKNCHPQKSVHIVKEIIDKFRNGEQDFAEFWINKPGMFLYITYTAVRDDNGKFKGILEMMQDCTHIRSLEGSQTLLTWKQGEEAEASETDNETDNETVSETGNETDNETDNETVNQTEPVSKDQMILKESTSMMELFESYPELRNQMEQIHPNFKALKTPLARIIMKKATVKDAAERCNMNVDQMISGIKQLISKM